ncbi:unnamed protein product [Amoebophrya sp. A120]|nr:unnamed protein product [Amoebophrya sp. A120]|eukprot:GSA120T00016103001.1
MLHRFFWKNILERFVIFPLLKDGDKDHGTPSAATAEMLESAPTGSSSQVKNENQPSTLPTTPLTHVKNGRDFLLQLQKHRVTAVHIRIAFGVKPWEQVADLARAERSRTVFISTDNADDPGVRDFRDRLEENGFAVFSSKDAAELLLGRTTGEEEDNVNSMHEAGATEQKAGADEQHVDRGDPAQPSREEENEVNRGAKSRNPAVVVKKLHGEKYRSTFDARGKLADMALLLDIVICVLAWQFIGSPYSSLSQLIGKFRLQVGIMYHQGTRNSKDEERQDDSAVAQSIMGNEAGAGIGSPAAGALDVEQAASSTLRRSIFSESNKKSSYDYFGKNTAEETRLLRELYRSVGDEQLLDEELENQVVQRPTKTTHYFHDGPATVTDVFPLDFYPHDVWSWLRNFALQMVRAQSIMSEESEDSDSARRSREVEASSQQPGSSSFASGQNTKRGSQPQWHRDAQILSSTLDRSRLQEKHYTNIVAGVWNRNDENEKRIFDIADEAKLYPCDSDLPHNNLPPCRLARWDEFSRGEVLLATQFFDYGSRIKPCVSASWALRLKFLLIFFLQGNYKEEECRHNAGAFGYLTHKFFLSMHEEALYRIANLAPRRVVLPMLNFLYQFLAKTQCRGQMVGLFLGRRRKTGAAPSGDDFEIVDQHRVEEEMTTNRGHQEQGPHEDHAETSTTENDLDALAANTRPRSGVNKGRPRLMEEDKTHELSSREFVSSGPGGAELRKLLFVSPAADVWGFNRTARLQFVHTGVVHQDKEHENEVHVDDSVDPPSRNVLKGGQENNYGYALKLLEFLTQRSIAKTTLRESRGKRGNKFKKNYNAARGGIGSEATNSSSRFFRVKFEFAWVEIFFSILILDERPPLVIAQETDQALAFRGGPILEHLARSSGADHGAPHTGRHRSFQNEGDYLGAALYRKILHAAPHDKFQKFVLTAEEHGNLFDSPTASQSTNSTSAVRDENENNFLDRVELLYIRLVQRVILATFHHKFIDTGNEIWRGLLQIKLEEKNEAVASTKFGLHCATV